MIWSFLHGWVPCVASSMGSTSSTRIWARWRSSQDRWSAGAERYLGGIGLEQKGAPWSQCNDHRGVHPGANGSGHVTPDRNDARPILPAQIESARLATTCSTRPLVRLRAAWPCRAPPRRGQRRSPGSPSPLATRRCDPREQRAAGESSHVLRQERVGVRPIGEALFRVALNPDS